MRRREFITVIFGAMAWPLAGRGASAEREIVDTLENCYGRNLTKEEIFLSLEQARAIGEIS